MNQIHIPTYGTVTSLALTTLDPPVSAPELVVKSYAPYPRFAIQIGDDGLDSFGLQVEDWAVFRGQRWPTKECQVCLISMGDEVTLRVMENVNSEEVVLRVSGEKIPSLELATSEFSVIGVLDGVVRKESVVLTQPEALAEDWGA